MPSFIAYSFLPCHIFLHAEFVIGVKAPVRILCNKCYLACYLSPGGIATGHRISDKPNLIYFFSSHFKTLWGFKAIEIQRLNTGMLMEMYKYLGLKITAGIEEFIMVSYKKNKKVIG